MAICVPVRDEEQSLPALLGALAAIDYRDVAAHACFYLDSCADESEAVLRDAAHDFSVPIHLTKGQRYPDSNAGRARRAAMALGLDVLGGQRNALLLCTDADSRPRADWAQAAVRALAVSDVAAGRLLRIGGARDALQGRIERYYDRLHAYRRAIDPVSWDTTTGCHCGGGANLAMWADSYTTLGGFAPLPAGEDARLLDDAARAGFRVRREPAMVVETSSRRLGRAPDGLAASLRALDVTGLPHMPHPNAAAWQWERHAAARLAFAAMDDGATRMRFGSSIGLSADHVLGVARDCPNAEAFAMQIVPTLPDAGRRVLLPDAERALGELEAALCRGAA